MKYFKRISKLLLILLLIPAILPAENDHYSRGVNSYLDGNMEEALEALEAAYEENPSDKRTIGLLSEVLVIKSGRYFEQGKIEQAFKLIKRAREVSPGDKKVENVYFMLDEKLHPEKYEVSALEVDEEAFGNIQREQEEKRKERTRIIENPPEKLTVRERELLRPILIGSEEKTSWSPGSYIATASAFLIIVLFITGSWIKRISAINADIVEKITEKTETRTEKMQVELRRLREKEEKRKERQTEEDKKRKHAEKLKEEKLKAQYQHLLKESRSSGSSPRKVAEPQISESKKEEQKRRELVSAFKRLKDDNTSAAKALLKKMSKNPNPWIRLASAQLASVLDAENARKSLYGLINDSEYGVKKEALRTLRGFLDDKATTLKEKRLIRELVDEQRSDGWVL